MILVDSSLNEYTRIGLMNRAKASSPDRYKRRTDSGDNWSVERVGLLELTISDDLYIYFRVNGYRVGLRIINYKPVLEKYLNGRYKNDRKEAITRSLKHALNYNNIQIVCECSDFKYRLAYMATQKGYGFDTNETRPAAKTNPNNQIWLCKHQLKVLSFPSRWIPKVIPYINGYLRSVDKKQYSIQK